MFEKEVTFDLDFTELDIDIVIPKGAATPSPVVEGAPHFQNTDTAPSFFFLNDDWGDHKTNLQNLGFTITETTSEFTATFTNGTGTVTGTWRKADGVLTHILFDDVYMGNMDATGMTVELSLDKLENRPLAVTVGDIIELEVENADITLTGSGDLYDDINQTEFSEVQSTIASIEGKTFVKFVINEVHGMFYTCSMYVYDIDDDKVNKVTDDDLYFNGFLGSIKTNDYPEYNGAIHDYAPMGLAPVVTPDWDIYEGYMDLASTLFGVYVEEMLKVLTIDEDKVVFNTLTPTWGFQKKQGYYYFQQALDADIDINMTSSVSPMLGVNGVFDAGFSIVANEKMYHAYHNSGVFAGFRVEGTIDQTIYDTTNYTGTGFVVGNVHLVFDFKLRNPDFNPPDAYGGGFIPGFEWLIAIPAIMGVAAISFISRKRK